MNSSEGEDRPQIRIETAVATCMISGDALAKQDRGRIPTFGNGG